MEVMYTVCRDLFLENIKLFYILRFFRLFVEIFADSNLFKSLIAMKCSKTRVEVLQILTVFVIVKINKKFIFTKHILCTFVEKIN